MLDRVFGLTFRNFSTFFLIVLLVTLPLHLAYAWFFRDVIAVADIHADIARFPTERQVRSVGTAQLLQANLAFALVVAIELALVPFMVRASEAVLDDDERARVPGALGAWKRALAAGPDVGGLLRALAAGRSVSLASFTFAVAVILIARTGATLVVAPLPDAAAFAAVGPLEAAAHAVGAPFFLVGAAIARSVPKGRTPRAPKL